MEDDKQVYLCLLAHAYLNSKFSIEFTSESQSMKQIYLDSTTTLRSSSKQTTFYQINATQ